MGTFVLLTLTSLPALLALILGIAPGLGGDALGIKADWIRALFVVAGSAITLLSLRAFAKKLLGARPDDAATRVRRAPYVGTVLVGSGLLLLIVVFAGGEQLTGEAAEPLRVVFGVYAVFLVLFGLPTFFARKLEQVQPAVIAKPDAPPSCSRCGVTLAAGASVCTYCGTPVG